MRQVLLALVACVLLGSFGFVRSTETTDAAAAAAAAEAEAEAVMPAITIGIAGGTGAGKTTLAKAVYEALGSDSNVAYLCHDSYYRDITHLTIDERAQTNFDHPDSLDTDLLIQHVQQLKGGEAAPVPTYDFTEHARTSEVTMVAPKKVDKNCAFPLYIYYGVCRHQSIDNRPRPLASSWTDRPAYMHV